MVSDLRIGDNVVFMLDIGFECYVEVRLMGNRECDELRARVY